MQVVIERRNLWIRKLRQISACLRAHYPKLSSADRDSGAQQSREILWRIGGGYDQIRARELRITVTAKVSAMALGANRARQIPAKLRILVCSRWRRRGEGDALSRGLEFAGKQTHSTDWTDCD